MDENKEKDIMKITPKIKDTLKLLERTGIFSRETLVKTFEQTMGYVYKLDKETVDEIVGLYMENEYFLDHTIEVANIYGSYYTHKEIKKIISFYDSPIGKKMTKNSSRIADEVYKAGVDLSLKTQDFMVPKIVEILEKNNCKTVLS